MSRVRAIAPAKVNLALHVGPLRAAGYHSLATVYQAIGLHDEVTAEPAGTWSVCVKAGGAASTAGVPTDESNLALRAARLLATANGVDQPVRLTIRKAIPVAGGLAGGSADAAAALVACDALWELGLPPDGLARLAARLGSDVPFAVVGGTAVGTGRGERVTPVTTQGSYWWVVVGSDQGLATPEVYRTLDTLRGTTVQAPEPVLAPAVLVALRTGDVRGLGAALSNDLQPAALHLRPDLRQVLSWGGGDPARGAVVSGSGPSCLFLAEERTQADEIADRLRARGLTQLSVVSAPVPGAGVVG